MKKSKGILLIVTLSVLCSNLLFSASADTTSIIDNIYDYDFHKATERLRRLNEKDPLLSKTLNLEMKWWMAIEKCDENRFSDFVYTLNQFEKTGNHDLEKLISSTYRIRYYACNHMSYMIPFLFLKIIRQIDEFNAEKVEALNNEELELFTLYKSFLTLIQNRVFINKFLSDPERQQELIRDIDEVICNGSSSNKTIGRYFLMKYYMDVEKDKSKAFRYLTELHGQYPKNKIFTQLLTN